MDRAGAWWIGLMTKVKGFCGEGIKMGKVQGETDSSYFAGLLGKTH